MTVLAIRFWREKRGMTQAELAKAVGLTEAHIRAYEGGFESPKMDTVIAIADALHVTPYDLAKGAWEK